MSQQLKLHSRGRQESDLHRQWASYQIRKLVGAHAPGTFSRRIKRKPRVSNPDMRHGTCVTQMPWCMPWSLTRGFLLIRGEGDVPGIPGACATRNFTYLVRGPCHSCWWHDEEGKHDSSDSSSHQHGFEYSQISIFLCHLYRYQSKRLRRLFSYVRAVVILSKKQRYNCMMTF